MRTILIRYKWKHFISNRECSMYRKYLDFVKWKRVPFSYPASGEKIRNGMVLVGDGTFAFMMEWAWHCACSVAIRLILDQRFNQWATFPTFPYSFGIDRMTFLLGYCDEWRVHRKLLHLSLKAEVVDKYQELYASTNSHRLLENLQQSPSKFREHLHL